MALLKEKELEVEESEDNNQLSLIEDLKSINFLNSHSDCPTMVTDLLNDFMSKVQSITSDDSENSSRFRTAGVLGGMGPEATLDLHRKILAKNECEKDQDNVPLMIFNNPQIPDRSECILNDGESPLDDMIETAKSLEDAGADFIVIPCNTAHHFFDKIDSSVEAETINLIEEVTDYIGEEYPDAEEIGLLITTGSRETEVYSDFIKESGRTPLLPEENFQENVMDSIYEIKKGEKTDSKRKLTRATEHLIREGADAVIMGCTEIPLVLSEEDFPVPLIDPVEILAERVTEVSKYESSYSA